MRMEAVTHKQLPTSVWTLPPSYLGEESSSSSLSLSDTSTILAWLIDEGYDVVAFMADVGQEEVSEVR